MAGPSPTVLALCLTMPILLLILILCLALYLMVSDPDATIIGNLISVQRKPHKHRRTKGPTVILQQNLGGSGRCRFDREERTNGEAERKGGDEEDPEKGFGYESRDQLRDHRRGEHLNTGAFEAWTPRAQRARAANARDSVMFDGDGYPNRMDANTTNGGPRHASWDRRGYPQVPASAFLGRDRDMHHDMHGDMINGGQDAFSHRGPPRMPSSAEFSHSHPNRPPYGLAMGMQPTQVLGETNVDSSHGPPGDVSGLAGVARNSFHGGRAGRGRTRRMSRGGLRRGVGSESSVSADMSRFKGGRVGGHWSDGRSGIGEVDGVEQREEELGWGGGMVREASRRGNGGGNVLGAGQVLGETRGGRGRR
jgi:hypothetical protein